MELVIDTASGALSVALLDGERIVADHHHVIGRGHAETIVAVVAAVVDDRRRAVRGIIVDVGPGSFTGVRIGVAAALGLGLAWGVPVSGIGTLDLVAAAAFAIDPAASVIATTDAGRGQLYWQLFTRDGCRAAGIPAAAACGGDVAVPPGAIVAGTGGAAVACRRVAVAEPRASDLRLLPSTARVAPRPLYLRAA